MNYVKYSLPWIKVLVLVVMRRTRDHSSYRHRIQNSGQYKSAPHAENTGNIKPLLSYKYPGYLLPPPLPDPVYCFWFSPSVAPVLSLICISLLFLLLIPVKIWFCILPSYYRINAFFCCIGLLSLRLSSFSTPSHTSKKPCISLLFCFWSAAWSPILLVFPVKYFP